MDADQLKQDVRDGRISPEWLIELLVSLQQRLEQAYQRIEELERKLGRKLGGSPTQKIEQPFSVEAEEKRQAARGKRKRPQPKPRRKGRISNAEKIAQAQRTEAVYPEGAKPEDCTLSHVRPLWRLEQGQAVLVAYEVYRRRNHYGKIPGALGRSEFGAEIIIAIAYQVYILGLSFDKVCAVMNFFQNLRLTKSQADSLMSQLARQWEGEFETLCTLLANSAVVYADETGWSIHSVWAFLSEKARVLLFGVHKDSATLEQILNPSSFAGVLISDDASVYATFSKTQKCWAHLLRKAIKLTLQAPDNGEYRQFADSLLAIYRKACRVKSDKRLGDAGRARKVAELDDELVDLCFARWSEEAPSTKDVEGDYRRLVHEIMRLMLRQELFTFVTEAAVEGTNNASERTLRGAAQARKTGRTSKTLAGARRQSVVCSVLESLRTQLPQFTLGSVVAEVVRWSHVGRSCFLELAARLGLKPPEHSVLDRVMPKEC
jgi:hypothetical protein